MNYCAARRSAPGRGRNQHVATATAALVAAASKGDEQSWSELVDRFTRLVWSVARAHGLSEADAADVCQTTWLDRKSVV